MIQLWNNNLDFLFNYKPTKIKNLMNVRHWNFMQTKKPLNIRWTEYMHIKEINNNMVGKDKIICYIRFTIPNYNT